MPKWSHFFCKFDSLNLFKKLLDACEYLEIIDLKEKLLTGLVISLTIKTLSELKEEYRVNTTWY